MNKEGYYFMNTRQKGILSAADRRRHIAFAKMLKIPKRHMDKWNCFFIWMESVLSIKPSQKIKQWCQESGMVKKNRISTRVYNERTEKRHRSRYSKDLFPVSPTQVTNIN